MVSFNKKQRISVLISQLREITDELNRLNLTSDDDGVSEEDVLVARFVGRRVKIVNGRFKLSEGMVTGRRGREFWWIDLDDGEKVYKMAHNFEVLEE